MDGSACSTVGFRVRKCVVTGESAGGNLAAALLVKLCYDGIIDVGERVKERRRSMRGSMSGSKRSEDRLEKLMTQFDEEGREKKEEKEEKEAKGEEEGGEGEKEGEKMMQKMTTPAEKASPPPPSPPPAPPPAPWLTSPSVRMPDALMLSCPALNMCHSISPSRVMGNGDPVLPTGIIAMIGNNYVPESSGISRESPLASPYFASDKTLACFPRTLLWVSSADPLLDDAVDFNTRLRRVGTESTIHAAQHMPHAFWALANAGFPEAVKVQDSCRAFLQEIIMDENVVVR